jgi:hypothetical protein
MWLWLWLWFGLELWIISILETHFAEDFCSNLGIVTVLPDIFSVIFLAFPQYRKQCPEVCHSRLLSVRFQAMLPSPLRYAAPTSVCALRVSGSVMKSIWKVRFWFIGSSIAALIMKAGCSDYIAVLCMASLCAYHWFIFRGQVLGFVVVHCVKFLIETHYYIYWVNG